MQLSDKFTLEEGRVYLTGIQALVRLPLDQVRRDRRAGHRTGVFISGYEGSPLGGYDLALARQRALLLEHGIHFQPGVNEELAATSVFGSQIAHLAGGLKVDGVTGIWYGKGPGVDRSGDALRHFNLGGTPGALNAVLVLAGDDHVSKSSTIPHQSDFSFYNSGIPFFFPGNIQEILDYGQWAIALSRFSGAWVGMKLVTDVCDGGGVARVHPQRPLISLPAGYEKFTDHRLVAPHTLALEYETHARRIAAARAFARANAVNRSTGAAGGAWLGIASAGKAYYDLAQALRDLGLVGGELERAGIRLAQFAMVYPLEPRFVRDFAEGLECILVVEEKRAFLELQLRELLYGTPNPPLILGKQDAEGTPLLPLGGELDPDCVAAAIEPLLSRRRACASAARRLERIQSAAERARGAANAAPARASAFCSGCPHNRSTILLEGQMGGGGIGCHAMAMGVPALNRSFAFLTHMGGEGAAWIGTAPFTSRRHIFQNVGDGTFFHSGQLALQACIAAGVNITYKILYNGHVAMTGGQAAAGALPIPELTRKLEAEGVRRTFVLAEDTEKYRGHPMAANAELRDRHALTRTLAEVERIPGVTVIIYDQQCAAEKRRWRSRGRLAEPVHRLVIHEEVCEGCMDCVKQSNCLSLTPVETLRGQKIRIHQPSCNKDYSCALGDCPSFVTVKIRPGTGLRKPLLPALELPDLPEPHTRAGLPPDGYRIVSPGIGGTGVVTVNALLATAAWIAGVSAITLDQTGLSQKGGAVVSHLLLCAEPLDAAAKANAASAALILGFDLLGVAAAENLKTADPDRTVAVLNTSLTPAVQQVQGRLPILGSEELLARIRPALKAFLLVDASRLSEALFGTHLLTNIFVLGYAYQAGLLPLPAAAIEQAMEWNGVDVERNRMAFRWGRRCFLDPDAVQAAAATAVAPPAPPLDREAELRAYQDDRYAAEYRDFLAEVGRRAPALRDTVARCLFKLMAYKDEYEVARLLTKPSFREQVDWQWEHVERIYFHLHPPVLRRLGWNRKLRLGEWAMPLLRALAWLRRIRGTPLDLFGRSAHRRRERSLIGWYRQLIREVMEHGTPDKADLALQIAALPDRIRGYESIKDASIEETQRAAEQLLASLRQKPVGVPVL